MFDANAVNRLDLFIRCLLLMYFILADLCQLQTNIPTALCACALALTVLAIAITLSLSRSGTSVSADLDLCRRLNTARGHVVAHTLLRRGNARATLSSYVLLLDANVCVGEGGEQWSAGTVVQSSGPETKCDRR